MGEGVWKEWGRVCGGSGGRNGEGMGEGIWREWGRVCGGSGGGNGEGMGEGMGEGVWREWGIGFFQNTKYSCTNEILKQ
jgi:hypothetical protein